MDRPLIETDGLPESKEVRARMVELAIQHVHTSHTIDLKTLEMWAYRTSPAEVREHFQGLVIELVGKIAAFRGKQRVTVKWPATWWDHLKDRVKKIWWLERALARLSVRYEEQTFHASLLLPQVEFPPLGEKLRYSYRVIEEGEPD